MPAAASRRKFSTHQSNLQDPRCTRFGTKIGFVVLALVGSLLPAYASDLESGYSQHVWHAEDGLPEETVQALAQTPNGFLWIGTSGGLLRFDGSQFTIFDRDNTSAFQDNSVFSLFVSRDGTLWIGTEGGGLIHYSGGKFVLYAKSSGLSNGYVRALREDGTGDLWIGTDDGLFRLHRGAIARFDAKNGVPPISVHAIYQDREQRLWFGGYHFFVKHEKKTQEVSLPGGLTDNVKSILQTSDGTMWVGTVSGLWKAMPQKGAPHFQRVPGARSTVRTLLENDDGSLLAGTIGEGLLQYRDGRLSAFHTGGILPSNTVLSTFTSAEGSLWIGTQTGLLRLNRTNVTTLALPDYADADFGTIYRDRDDSLWVGSSHLFHVVGGRVQEPHWPAALNGIRIRTVFRDSHGQFWIGTEGRGAYRIRNGVAEPVPGMQAYIRAFAEDHAGGIWIGTDGGYSLWTPQHTTYFEPHESVRAITVDRDGYVWVGKDRGVTVLRPPDFAPTAPIARLAGEKVWAIHQDRSGAMWFGTRGAGLFRRAGGTLTSYTTAQGLASNSVYQILEDNFGTLWMSGPNGVESVKLAELNRVTLDPSYRPAVRLYGTSDGLTTTQMYGGVQPAGCITAAGEVWFPSTAGPVRIGLDSYGTDLLPRAIIYGAAADGRDVRLGGSTLNIGPGEGKLDVQYGAVQLRSPERVGFRYLLEGIDHNWTETRTKRASYTNIPPGTYTFHLEAFDVDQPRKVSHADLQFHWRPHLYQTRSFFLMLLVPMCLLTWVLYRLRIQQVRARFDAVLEERNRLAREMHDTLIQGCTSTSALLEAIASMRPEQAQTKDELLNHARLQVRALADESRRAVWNLRQHAADGPDLHQLLKQMAQQASEGSHVAVEIANSGVAAPIDPLTEHDLVMIAREAVHNAIKHAQPTEVRVQLRSEPHSLDLDVIDNGCGFNMEDARSDDPEHFGLVGMRERTARLGGRFEVNSRPGSGTTVKVHIPVRPSDGRGGSREQVP